MTDIQQSSAIRTRIWLGGKYTTRDPLPVQISPKRFEVKTVTSNLGLRVDRPFVFAGFPNVRNRREFTLPWADLREPPMLEHLDVLANIGQPFGLGLWKQEYDIFDGDATNKTFFLQRRQLLPVVTPSPTFPDYPTRVIVYDRSYLDPAAVATEQTVVQKTNATIDTGNPPAGTAWVESDGRQIGNLWVSEIRLGTAPPAASDCVVAAYLPLYTVVVDQEAPRSYAQALVEPRSLRLVEFG